jgi:serine/threonine protein kinase/Tol biopolymer transport system component
LGDGVNFQHFMPLVSGTRLGSYEVQSVLGEGGMGIVYRAHDTKLKRDVALKVLPDHLAGDEARLSRFQREAQALAAVNHSNIAQIYGLEESGNTRCIVMELVEGETLQELVQRGPVPIEEVLSIARQIADGLEAAHERGIVHRDLKPANIKRTQNGIVKILDFGLARIFETASPDMNLMSSPTMMSGTAAGMIIGTAAYMSPEQARGKVADTRSDIWAFGAVVFELLTGRQAFAGETLTDLLASVIKNEPEWNALPSPASEELRSLLRRCLQKDLRRRLQHIGDARIAIEDILAGQAAPSTAVPPARRSRERYVWGLAILVLTAATVFLGINYFQDSPVDDAPLARFSVVPPEKTIFRPDGAFQALSQDGTKLAFVATESLYQPPRLWVRHLDSVAPQALSGTEGAQTPFWSPDGRAVGFFAGGKLKTVELPNGTPQTVSEMPPFWRATWNRDGVIIFGAATGPLRRVMATGGDISDATELDKTRGETAHRSPVFLPDGRHFLFSLDSAATPPMDILLGSADSKDSKTLWKERVDWLGGYVAPGYLLYQRDTTVMALPFDLKKLKVTGEPVAVVNDIEGNFSASANGVLSYRTAAASDGVKLVWFDRTGKQVGIEPVSGALQAPNLSRDGKRVAFQQASGRNTSDIRILDLLRGTNMRVTLEGSSGRPVFSPDGTRVVFARYTSNGSDVVVKSASGTGPEQRLEENSEPTDWSPDGRHILILRGDGLYLLSLTEGAKSTPLITNPGGRRARFSPDGKWISYESNVSGRYEIYVQRFPPAGDRVQVSVNGGDSSWWRSDGRELFFNSPDRKLMAVDVKLGATFEAGVPHALFEVPGLINNGRFVASLDGNRFLMPIQFQDEFQPLTVILNWPSTLKK